MCAHGCGLGEATPVRVHFAIGHSPGVYFTKFNCITML